MLSSFGEVSSPSFILSFRQLDPNLDIPGKREPQLRTCFHQISLWAGLWGHFQEAAAEGRRPSSEWVASPSSSPDVKRSTGRAVLFVYLSLLLADDCICLVVVLLHFIDITTHSDVPSDVHYRPAALLESWDNMSSHCPPKQRWTSRYRGSQLLWTETPMSALARIQMCNWWRAWGSMDNGER